MKKRKRVNPEILTDILTRLNTLEKAIDKNNVRIGEVERRVIVLQNDFKWLKWILIAILAPILIKLFLGF